MAILHQHYDTTLNTYSPGGNFYSQRYSLQPQLVTWPLSCSSSLDPPVSLYHPGKEVNGLCLVDLEAFS